MPTFALPAYVVRTSFGDLGLLAVVSSTHDPTIAHTYLSAMDTTSDIVLSYYEEKSRKQNQETSCLSTWWMVDAFRVSYTR